MLIKNTFLKIIVIYFLTVKIQAEDLLIDIISDFIKKQVDESLDLQFLQQDYKQFKIFMNQCQQENSKSQCRKIIQIIKKKLQQKNQADQNDEQQLSNLQICKKFQFFKQCRKFKDKFIQLSKIKQRFIQCQQLGLEQQSVACQNINFISNLVQKNFISFAQTKCITCDVHMLREYIDLCHRINYVKNGDDEDYDQKLNFCDHMLYMVRAKLETLQQHNYLTYKIRNNFYPNSPQLIEFEFSMATKALIIYNDYLKGFMSTLPPPS